MKIIIIIPVKIAGNRNPSILNIIKSLVSKSYELIGALRASLFLDSLFDVLPMLQAIEIQTITK